MIQLLYGNNGVNYAEIARSRNLSGDQYKELYKNYLGYPLAVNPELYERKEWEPIAYNILVTNLSGKLPRDMLMLSKKAKMCSYETPCYYAHVQFTDIEEDLLTKDFADLFKYDFIKEGEIKEHQDGLIEGFGREKAYDINDRVLREEQIKASLYLLYKNMESWTKKVTIITDVDGKDYNQRALDIVASIYRYIPWSLRKRVGFTTYSTPDVREAEQIKIRIMPRWCLDKCDHGEVLDFKSSNLMEAVAISNVPDQIRGFVDRLWEEKGKREQWFRVWWEAYKSSGDLQDHLDYCYKCDIWMKGDLKEHFKEIMEYALDKRNEEKEQYKMFIKVIARRIEQKIYDEIMAGDLDKVQDIDDFYKKCKNYAAFADIFPSIKLNTAYAAEWFEKKCLEEVLKEQDGQIKFHKLTQLLKKLTDWDWKFIPKKVKNKWKNKIRKCAKELQEKIETEKERIETEKKKEKEEIREFIDSLADNEFYITDVKEYYGHIRYKEDHEEYFRKQLSSFLESGIKENDMSFREENYLKYGQWMRKCQGIIDENDYSRLDSLQEEIAEKRRDREELLFIMWNTRDDIKEYYDHRARIHLIYGIGEGMADEDMKYKLIINGERFLLAERQMDAIADYLMSGTKEKWEKAKRVFEEENSLLVELEKNGFLKRKKRGIKGMFRSKRESVKK